MATSQGTMSDNWVKGLGSAGGVLGSIRLRGGMTLWDGEKWQGSWDQDQATLSDWTIRYRTGDGTGYYPDPQSLVASNGFYDASGNSQPSVTSAVITDDAQGRPIGFVTMGYATGYLMAIDGKVGDPMAKATYSSGGPHGMDSRLHDLSTAVNRETANAVEVLKGSWQGPGGSEQGTLLLVGTTAGTGAHFWVLKPDLTDMNNPSAAPYALATLPAKITRIVPDPVRMLVGVEAGGRAYIFDLKNLQPSVNIQGTTPMTLTPIYDFAVSGAWTLDKGMLIEEEGTAVRRLVVKNLDGVTITPKLGIPLLVDANQFFAGAFYDYNKSVLGDYNPPPQPEMPERLVYSLTNMQGQNGGEGKAGGYPTLRHYYPDLGEMHISGVVNLQNPTQFLEATKDGSPWFMEAEAKLYNGDTEVSGAVSVEGLSISGNQRMVAGNGTQRSKVFGNGDVAKAELSASGISGAPADKLPDWQKKFAYAPFRFFIKPDVLVQLDQDMRTDFKERFRVKVELKLYKDESQRASGSPEATLKTFEFAVKFNSNTRLFDVLRGGVWYFDPVVASKDPSDTAQNPFTAEWMKRLVDAQGTPIDFGGIFQTRLSLTPGTSIKKDSSFNGVVFSDDMVVHEENALAWVGLDVVQKLLDSAMPKLRRQVFDNDPRHRMVPLAQRFRKVFEEAPRDDQDRLDTTRAADAIGAYGYRMAHVVNAVQAFSSDEAAQPRSLNNPKPNLWAADPTLKNGEKDPEGRKLFGSIAPLLNQHMKNGKEYNSGNMLVNYLVAYPRLRIQGTRDNGLYPINTMLTRDLVIGPMGLSSSGFEGPRKQIDECVNQFNQLPSPHDAGKEDELKIQAKDLSVRLSQALLSQRIITNSGSKLWPSGEFFNSGLGMLQLGLQETWTPSEKTEDEIPSIPPTDNKHLYFWVSKPKSMDYENGSSFNVDMRAGVLDFLLKHRDATRLDVYINGVNNTIEEVEKASNFLQQRVDHLGGLDGESAGSLARTPVFVVYNASAKRYYGGVDELDVLDLGECARMKRDTATPFTKTEHTDAVKLIGMLRAMVQELYGKPFTTAYLDHHMGKGLTFEEARNKLHTLRQNLTLHAHSQGALVAAIAQTRLGPGVKPELPERDGWGFPETDKADVGVANAFHLVTYGGAGNMLDWGPNTYYRSYVHHVNDKDLVAWLVGMGDPFQNLLGYAAPTLRKMVMGGWVVTPSGMLTLQHVTKGSVASALVTDPFNPHISKIISGPSDGELARWKSGDHLVIRHASDASIPNIDEHGFPDGYGCAIGKESEASTYPRLLPGMDSLFPRWFWMYLNPNLLKGKKGCLYK